VRIRKLTIPGHITFCSATWTREIACNPASDTSHTALNDFQVQNGNVKSKAFDDEEEEDEDKEDKKKPEVSSVLVYISVHVQLPCVPLLNQPDLSFSSRSEGETCLESWPFSAGQNTC
jgi:hypothetical protein